MTLKEIKEQVMFQTNNDAEDLGDFEPHINDYVNEGYDILIDAMHNVHLEPDNDKYYPMSKDEEVPNLPNWLHRALADYATWMVYRNGNAVKQNRGYAFRQEFDAMLSKARLWMSRNSGASGQFYNIYP